MKLKNRIRIRIKKIRIRNTGKELYKKNWSSDYLGSKYSSYLPISEAPKPYTDIGMV